MSSSLHFRFKSGVPTKPVQSDRISNVTETIITCKLIVKMWSKFDKDRLEVVTIRKSHEPVNIACYSVMWHIPHFIARQNDVIYKFTNVWHLKSYFYKTCDNFVVLFAADRNIHHRKSMYNTIHSWSE